MGDVWSLCDDAERPVGSFRVASSAITSMSFQSDLLPGEYDQLLALGDQQGNLHVFDVPLPLRKNKPNDIDTFKAFIRSKSTGRSKVKQGWRRRRRRPRRRRSPPRTRKLLRKRLNNRRRASSPSLPKSSRRTTRPTRSCSASSPRRWTLDYWRMV